jgi:hypothetical protein
VRNSHPPSGKEFKKEQRANLVLCHAKIHFTARAALCITTKIIELKWRIVLFL